MIVHGKEINQATKDINGFCYSSFHCDNQFYTFKEIANALIKNWLWRKDEVQKLKKTIIKNRKLMNSINNVRI